MIEFKVSNQKLGQANLIPNYNAFIDELVRSVPHEVLQERNVSTNKLNATGICGGDAEMCAYFHHLGGNLDEFLALKSFLTEGLSTEEERKKLAKAYKENAELKIKIGNYTNYFWEFLHFANGILECWKSQNSKDDINAWRNNSQVIGWTWGAPLAQYLTDLNVKNNRYTSVAWSHIILIINERGKFYVCDSNPDDEPRPLSTLEEVAAELTNSILILHPHDIKSFHLTISSLSFEAFPEQYLIDIQTKYPNDEIIGSLIKEFKAGLIAFEILKRVIDIKEGKPAQNFGKWIDTKSIHTPPKFKDGSNSGSILFKAAQDGDLLTVQWLLEEGADLNLKDYRGLTPILIAAGCGHFEIVKLLASKGAKIDETDEKGVAPFYKAANNGHFEIAEWLLKNGADVNYCWNGFSLLYLAAENGLLEVADLLLKNGAEVNLADGNGFTPLHKAAEMGHWDIAKLLLEKKAKVNYSSHDGSTPLALAARYGRLEIAELFLKNGAEVDLADGRGFTPLHKAAAGGYFRVVQLLVENKAKINEVCKVGATAIYVAAQNGNLEVVKWLLLKGAEVNLACNDDGSTPLYVAAEFGHAEVVAVLLQHGAQIDRGRNGFSSLYIAAQKGQLEVVKVLLKKGATVDYLNNGEKTAIYIAALNKHFDVVKVLLEGGAEIDITCNGETLFYTALNNNEDEVSKFLLDRVLSSNDPNQTELVSQFFKDAQKFHQTEMAERLQIKLYNELCNAIRIADVERVKSLVELDFDINFVPVSDYRTPLYIAVLEGRWEIVQCLLVKADINAHLDALLHNKLKFEESENPMLLFMAAQKNTPDCNQIFNLILFEYGKLSSKQSQNDLDMVFCYAVMQGDCNKVRKLLMAGANVKLAYSSKNKDKETPYQVAKRCNYQNVTKLLDETRHSSGFFSFLGRQKPKVDLPTPNPMKVSHNPTATSQQPKI